MRKENSVLTMVIAALLCALGLLIPNVMPRVQFGPMSFTLASHVPTFLAMFISLPVTIAVCVVTAIGFFLSTTVVIGLRATSHLLFAVVGALLLKKSDKLTSSPITVLPFGLFLSVIHAIAEVLVVTVFFFGGQLDPSVYTKGFPVAVLLLVGVGTLLHSMMDYVIALAVWQPLLHVIRIPVYAKKPITFRGKRVKEQ